MEELEKKIERIRVYLSQERDKEILRILQGIRPADIATLVENLKPEEGAKLLKLFRLPLASSVLSKIDNEARKPLLEEIESDYLSRILNLIPSDEAADIVDSLPPAQAIEILQLMEEEEAAKVKELLQHEEETAGGLMNADFVALSENLSVEEAIQRIRENFREAEVLYYIYTVDKNRKLTGVLSLRKLFLCPPNTLLKEIAMKDVISVPPEMDQEEVAEIARRYDLVAVPVVDKENKLLGVVTIDDLVDVVQEEAREDIYRIAGTSAREEFSLFSPFKIVKLRFPFLLICLVGETISAWVLKSFGNTLQTVVAVAFFIPYIMDTGGNVGTQSAAIMIRGLALKTIDFTRLGKILLKELSIGAILGLITGTVVALASQVFAGGNIKLGVAVGIGMVGALSISSLTGTFFPFLFHKFRIDPALAAGPLITTINDVIGIAFYLFMATFLLI